MAAAAAGATIAAAAGGNPTPPAKGLKRHKGKRRAANKSLGAGPSPGRGVSEPARAPGKRTGSLSSRSPSLAGIRWGHSEDVWGQVSEPRLGWMALLARALRENRVHLGRPRLLHLPGRNPVVGSRGRRAQLLASPAQEAGARINQPSRGGLFRAEALLSSLPSPLGPTPGSPLAKGKSTINFFLGQMGSSQQCSVKMHRPPFLFLQSCLPGRPPKRQMNTLILSGILQSLSGRLPSAPRSFHFNLQQGGDACSGPDARGELGHGPPPRTPALRDPD